MSTARTVYSPDDDGEPECQFEQLVADMMVTHMRGSYAAHTNIDRIAGVDLVVPSDGEYDQAKEAVYAAFQAKYQPAPISRRVIRQETHRATRRLLFSSALLLLKPFIGKFGLPEMVRFGLSPGSLTRAAVFLAGRKRRTVGLEWRAHLAGWSGAGLSRRDQVHAARSFILAALRYRLEDVADLAWRPADAVLGSRVLSNLFVWGPVILTLVAIVHHDGRFGLVADDQDPVALGAFLCVVIKTGRWRRQIKLPEPKPRRAKE